jgi:hypothetical protein
MICEKKNKVYLLKKILYKLKQTLKPDIAELMIIL